MIGKCYDCGKIKELKYECEECKAKCCKDCFDEFNGCKECYIEPPELIPIKNLEAKDK